MAEMILTLYQYALIPCFWLMYYLFISVSGLFFLKWLKGHPPRHRQSCRMSIVKVDLLLYEVFDCDMYLQVRAS